MKRALILGIGGMDGSYLADILVERGVEVHGLFRHSSLGNLRRVEHLEGRITLHEGDVLDYSSLYRLIDLVEPDVIFNEADQDHVGASFETPLYSVQVTYGGCANVLEAVRQLDKKWEKDAEQWISGGGTYPLKTRVFQPCSATMFKDEFGAKHEDSKLDPQSPYACAKAAAYHLCRFYRRHHGLHVSTGIMFNHDSPRRGPGYLLGRIIKEAKEVKAGKRTHLELSNLEHRVDIGCALEYMEAAVRIVEQDKPDDYVIGTGVGVEVGDLAKRVFDRVGIVGAYPVHPNPVGKHFKGPELIADIGKAKRVLGWQPETDALGVVDLLLEGVK